MFHVFRAHDYEAALYYITLSMQVCTLPFSKGCGLVRIQGKAAEGHCKSAYHGFYLIRELFIILFTFIVISLLAVKLKKDLI